MKKCISILMIFTVLFFSGCSMIGNIVEEKDEIQKVMDWSFQYNESTDDYSVFFGLCNKKGKFISADIDVEIKIVNDKKEVVYKDKRSVLKDDFDNYTSKIEGTQYLANVRIPETDIKKGKSRDGKVYIVIYKDGVQLFDKINCEAFDCLPIGKVKLSAEKLPVEIFVEGYDGKITSKIRVEKVDYTFDEDLLSLKIEIFGTKVFGGRKLLMDDISYKVYDSQNYCVDTGTIYLDSLEKDDKFRDDSINIYDIVPGEKYKIKFMKSKY